MTAAQTLDGKRVAREFRESLAQKIEQHYVGRGKRPGLAVVRVGEDPASQVYVENKRKASAAVGIDAREIHLPADISEHAVIAEVEGLNRDPAVHGILVQLPLPGHIRPEAVLDHLDPSKDVDGLTSDSLGRLTAGRPRLVPCTPLGIMHLLERYSILLSGCRAAVIGRSRLVGLPMALLLCRANATVTIVHRETVSPREVAASCDLLVVAAGSRGLVGADWIKPGGVVVDVGMHRTDAGLAGDVRHDEAAERAGWLTPVPGGVGPLTVAMLLGNTWSAFLAQSGQSPWMV